MDPIVRATPTPRMPRAIGIGPAAAPRAPDAPLLRRSRHRSDTTRNAGKTVSMAARQSRYPSPMMNPNSENPLKSVIISEKKATAVVAPEVSMACPVRAMISFRDSSTPAPARRLSR